MKYFHLSILIFGIFYITCVTGAGRVPLRCFDAPTQHYWNAGTSYNPIGQCVSLQCNSRGQRVQLSCPIISTEGCRKQPVNLRKPYPQCCPTCRK
ncbi:unnamed protein product [Hermetia illucens]|uniref:Single domain-containing protein n=1 Tax=Hermetia illucens TaxID=343691 RepID=A0A7R8YVE4_HERIL|nr:unnamed protein product [Hermetia illucens]